MLCEMDNSAIVLCCMRVAFYMEWSAVLTTVPRDAGSILPGPCPGPAPPGGGEETIDLDLLMSIIYRGTVYFTLLRSLVGWCVCWQCVTSGFTSEARSSFVLAVHLRWSETIEIQTHALLSVCLSVNMFVGETTRRHVYLSVCLSVCLFVCSLTLDCNTVSADTVRSRYIFLRTAENFFLRHRVECKVDKQEWRDVVLFVSLLML